MGLYVLGRGGEGCLGGVVEGRVGGLGRKCGGDKESWAYTGLEDR